MREVRRGVGSDRAEWEGEPFAGLSPRGGLWDAVAGAGGGVGAGERAAGVDVRCVPGGECVAGECAHAGGSVQAVGHVRGGGVFGDVE